MSAIRPKTRTTRPAIGCRGHDDTPDTSKGLTRVTDNVRLFRQLHAQLYSTHETQRSHPPRPTFH